MCAGMIISLYKYVKLCTGGQGGGKRWETSEDGM